MAARPRPEILVWRRRVEAVIVVVAPALDLLLAVGDRVARGVGSRSAGVEPPRQVGAQTPHVTD